MKTLIRILWIVPILLLPWCTKAQSYVEIQEINKLKEEVNNLKNKTKSGKSEFLLRGYAHAGLEASADKVTFEGGSFNPIFIYKQSDRLLFESELEFELENNKLDIGLEYANISYLLTKTLTLRVGKILTPYGIFVTRLHPAWINKFSTKPLGLGHSGILPTSDIGIDLRGGTYIGSLKINYSLYLLNGPQLNNGEEEPEEAGRLHYGLAPDNNKNKAVGGRIGILPFSNSSLELGFSGMLGKVGEDKSVFEDIRSQLYAFDVTYVRNLTFMKSVLDIKGQLSLVNVDQASFAVPLDTTGLTYSFTNKSSSSFIQFSLRPALLSTRIIRNLEFAARYSTLRTPEGSEWESNVSQWEFGLNYWIDWRTAFKLTYRLVINRGGNGQPGDHGGEIPENGLFVHWAIGF